MSIAAAYTGVLRAFPYVLTFALTLFVRVRGISTHFWMLWDQIRDWGIALGPFTDLPLVGPPTHFRGFTIGPAFYWVLWSLRVTIGPWFDNLPHAGGIGQALLQSAADALLLAAVWKRTRSLPIALVTVVLVATSAYDIALAPLVWNPVMGSILAKAAIALVLLDWPRGSRGRIAVVTLIAWSAVHSYTGAVYVAFGVFAAIVAPCVFERRWRQALSYAAVIAGVVAVLQLPWAIHRFSSREGAPVMGVVTGSLSQVLTGRASPRAGLSMRGYVEAFSFIQGFPNRVPAAGWILLAAAVIAVVRYRRDPALLTVLLLPQALAIVGYALFQGGLDHYYYLSLMPSAVLTVVLAATALPDPSTSLRAGRWQQARNAVALLMLVAALAAVPGRLTFAATMHRMPEYAPLVEGSRRAVRQRQPMRSIETEFTLPAPSDPTFVYRILGGKIDPASPWVARIRTTGDVDFRKVD
jgi:hypothetical protein